jgi:hypothetical protein
MGRDFAASRVFGGPKKKIGVHKVRHKVGVFEATKSTE